MASVEHSMLPVGAVNVGLWNGKKTAPLAFASEADSSEGAVAIRAASAGRKCPVGG
eukprot:SAG22_NODE_1529_length_4218_cov_2.153435_7_plen_56_part_00